MKQSINHMTKKSNDVYMRIVKIMEEAEDAEQDSSDGANIAMNGLAKAVYRFSCLFAVYLGTDPQGGIAEFMRRVTEIDNHVKTIEEEKKINE